MAYIHIYTQGHIELPKAARCAILSRASAQLKHQNLRVGGYTEEVLEWFNYMYPRERPHRMRSYMWLPGGTKSTGIVASTVLRRGQLDGGGSCIVDRKRTDL